MGQKIDGSNLKKLETKKNALVKYSSDACFLT